MADYINDTIAAVSTAVAPAGIGIVRMSGKDVFEVADRVYRNKKGTRIADQKGYTVHYGHIYDNDTLIDEALVVVMRAPHSYTGEDTVEIDCHGGILAVRKILEAVIHAGARPAEPGEFSRRAFLNGRMDLSQAESVMDIISAKNDYALQSAERQLEGSLAAEIKKIRGSLLHETARIEAALDDPENMSLDGCKEEIRKTVLICRENIEKLIKTADSGKIITEGIKTAIIGKPNVGKSTLLNLLTGDESAIVTDIPGTTRDILEEQVNIKGITLDLTDTAGIRKTTDIIEKIGVDKAVKKTETADLVLFVTDGSVPLDDNDREIMRLLSGKKVIFILNKSDVEQKLTEENIRETAEECGITAEGSVVPMSAKNGNGLDELADRIADMFFGGEISFNDEIYITNERHRAALEDASSSLDYVLKSIDGGMPEDFWSIDMTGACDALGKITGETTGEDLVNEIFSKFCMGK